MGRKEWDLEPKQRRTVAGNTESQFLETGEKLESTHTDAGRWADVVVGAHGSSFQIASIFSVK